jgi:biotin carboxylase
MKHIIFVESNSCGLQAIKTAKELGYYVSFIRSPHFEYMYKYDELFGRILPMIDNCVLLDEIFDEDKLLLAIEELNRKKPVDAIISVLEYVILYVARVAKRLGIAYTDLEGVENSRDKSKMRKKLEEAKLSVVDYVSGDDYDSLLEKADELGYPLIVKPAKGVASFLIKKASNYDELKNVLGTYKNEFMRLKKIYQTIFSEKIIIEKHLTGKMFSLEIGALNNNYFPFAITDRKRYNQDESIELGGTMNADFPPDIIKEIHDYGINFLKTIGLNLGIFHLEMILTENGPVIIDPNPRLIGGLAPKMLSLVIGHNIYEVLIDIHLNHLNKLLETDFSIKCYATDRDFACSDAGILKNDIDFQWLNYYYKNGLVDFRLDISPGETYKKVTSNHDYIGAIVVKAPTPFESKKLAEEILLKTKDSLSVPLILDGFY